MYRQVRNSPTTVVAFLAFLAGHILDQNGTSACSDVLVTPKASADGSSMIAYNADDLTLYGILYHYPPTQGKAGENITVYEWDTGVSLIFNGSRKDFSRGESLPHYSARKLA